MRKKILLPVDGSEQAKRAGEEAIAMADAAGDDIIVLYVIDTDYLYALPQQELSDQISEGLRKEGEKALELFRKDLEVKQCGGTCKNINITTKIKEGKPADVILKTIEEEGVNQVVMGKSGKRGIEKLMLGSTTERVLRSAGVPVNVVS